MIVFKEKGSWKKTEKLLTKMINLDLRDCLNKYGEQGVAALASNTPVDTGNTAASWYYKIKVDKRDGFASIVWSNRNVVKNTNIAIILQYGHGTRNGGYVEGRDYINPALRPVFDAIAEEAWREVTNA